MPPKQNSNADRITALEEQFGTLTTLLEDMRAEMKANHQRSLEIEQKAKERHCKVAEEKQTRVESGETSNPNPRDLYPKPPRRRVAPPLMAVPIENH